MKKIAALVAVVILLTACQPKSDTIQKTSLVGNSLTDIGVVISNYSAILGEDAANLNLSDSTGGAELNQQLSLNSPYYSNHVLSFQGSVTSCVYGYETEAKMKSVYEGKEFTDTINLTVKNPVMLLQAYRKADIESGGTIEITYTDTSNTADTFEKTLIINQDNMYTYCVGEVGEYLIYDWLDFYVGLYPGFIVNNEIAQKTTYDVPYDIDYNGYVVKLTNVKTAMSSNIEFTLS